MKRFLALILCVTAMITLFPLGVIASGGVCYIQSDADVFYDTVADAVAAASDGDIIVMTANSVEKAQINLKTKSITIEGNGFTIDSASKLSDSKYQFYNSESDGTQTFTVKNAVLKNKRGFWFYPWVLNIENCTVVTEKGYALDYQPAKNEKDASHSINIKDTRWTVNENGGTYTFALMGDNNIYSCGVLNITNSEINFYGGSEGETNGCMFDCYTLGDMTVNILGDSKLRLLGEYGRSFFSIRSDARYVINLAEGVEMIFASQCKTQAFMTNDGVTVNDNGAVWKNESDAAASITFPTLTREGKELIGWRVGDKVYHKNAEVGEFSEFYPIFFSSDEFALAYGASLRTVTGEFGLRFATNVSDALYESLGKSASYKTYLVPLTEGETDPMGETVKEKLDFEHEVFATGFYDGCTTMYSAVIMRPAWVDEEKIFSLSLSAYSEMTVTYADGGETVLYTEFDLTDNTRSMSQVAYYLEEQGMGNSVSSYILSVCPYIVD